MLPPSSSPLSHHQPTNQTSTHTQKKPSSRHTVRGEHLEADPRQGQEQGERGQRRWWKCWSSWSSFFCSSRSGGDGWGSSSSFSSTEVSERRKTTTAAVFLRFFSLRAHSSLYSLSIVYLSRTCCTTVSSVKSKKSKRKEQKKKDKRRRKKAEEEVSVSRSLHSLSLFSQPLFFDSGLVCSSLSCARV